MKATPAATSVTTKLASGAAGAWRVTEDRVTTDADNRVTTDGQQRTTRG